jgi:hypothetical protein
MLDADSALWWNWWTSGSFGDTLFCTLFPMNPFRKMIAAALGVSESHVKVAVHRYRNRYRVLLRDEIARTVDDPAEVEQEITTLIEALTV